MDKFGRCEGDELGELWDENEVFRECAEDSSCESDCDCDSDLRSQTRRQRPSAAKRNLEARTSSGEIPSRPRGGKKAVVNHWC
jgi:hypothetical protein